MLVSGLGRRILLVVALAALSLAGAHAGSARAAEVPHIKHLFVIVMENENAEETFGGIPPAPYLGNTMREEGAFLPNYYGIGHQSLDNYLALISGQPPNVATQADCPFYSNMLVTSTEPDGVAVGQGCVFPASVRTVANQLEEGGHTWRSYNQDMAAGAGAGESTTCRHPNLGSADGTQKATKTNQYAARHDPFVYFHAIIDSATCGQNVVDLNQLPQDLQSPSTSPEYAFITPDLCYDGHEATCPDESSPAGYAGIDAFLEEWVARIKASPAYQDHGAIMVTFDESESGAESCCNEQNGPNTPNNGGTTSGSGGGRVGAVIESPCIKPGTISLDTYNHYSALRWTEDNFGLSHLADASTEGLRPFGPDVFTNPSCTPAPPGGAGKGGGGSGGGGGAAGPPTHLKVTPHRVQVGAMTLFRFHLGSAVASCRAGAVIHFAGHHAHTSRKGKARIKAKLPHPGKWTATARPRSCAPSKTTIHARP